METKKTKEATYTKAQVRHLIARIFAKLAVELEDPSLVVAGMMVWKLWKKSLKRLSRYLCGLDYLNQPTTSSSLEQIL